MSIANDKIVNLQDAKVLYDDLRGRIKDNSVVEVLDTPADIQSFSDAARFPMELKVGIDPVQDLHGYDHPWVGGASKNLLPILDSAVLPNVSRRKNDDGSITWYGKSNGTTRVPPAGEATLPAGTYIVSGCTGGSANTYGMRVRRKDNTDIEIVTFYDGEATFTLTEETAIEVVGRFSSNQTSEFNVTMYPMIRLSTESDSTFTPYENICPISGWTGVNVSVTGKNLWDEQWEVGMYNTSTGEKASATNRIRSKNKIPVCPGQKLYLKGTSDSDIYLLYYKKNGEFVSGEWSSGEKTIGNDIYFIAFHLAIAYGTTYNNDISINCPSSETEYDAYRCTTYPITFPTSTGTVYGGELTIHSDGSGTLVSNMGFVTLSGTAHMAGGAPASATDSKGGKRITTDIEAKYSGSLSTVPNVISDKLTTISASNIYGGTQWPDSVSINDANRIVLRFDGATTNAEIGAKLQNNPVQLCYELLTPVTYQLTPSQVFALLGSNNVWADCGQINYLEYVRDTVGEVIPNRFDGIEQDIVETNTYEKTISEANAIQTFEDGANWAMGLNVAVDPVQDLHGYDHPWPAGGGKNLFPLKAKNSYTSHGITFTPKVDDDGNVISIIVNGTNDGTASSVYDTVTGTVPTASARQTDIDFSKSYLFTGAQSENIALNLWAYDSNGTYIYGYYNRSTSATTINNSNIVSYVPIIEIRNGVTVNNVEVKPMLRLSTVSDATFEPYTNICPISGFTGANVTVTGKNLFNKNDVNPVYITSEGEISSSTYAALSDYIMLPEGKCAVSCKRTSASDSRIRVGLYDENKTFIERIISDGAAAGATDTLIINNANVKYVRVNIFTDSNLIDTCQCEYGTTVTAYEPFGEIYNVTFPASAGTVYGGNLTVNKDGTGELVVDTAFYEFDGSVDEEWGIAGTNKFARTTITAYTNRDSAICNRFVQAAVASGNELIGFYLVTVDNAQIRIRYKNSTVLTEAEVRQWLSENPVQVVYELAVPVTYSLTPGQVLSILGQNNVWADTGDILSLTYNRKQGLEFIREDTAGQINAVVNPVKTELDSAEAAIAIVVDGDTAPKNITVGQYVFVKNHSTLATGMYHATAAIASGASVTSSNVEADADGIINSLTVAQDITSAFSFGTGWGGVITAYKYGRIISLIVVASTHPTLDANTRYTNVVQKSGAAYSPIIQLHATGWQSDNFRDFDNIVHITLSDSASAGFSVTTGATVNENTIRFYVMYIAQA